MKKMKVCVVTGTRAEFGIWRPVLAAIGASKLLELQLLVTGMHLQRGFGLTVRDIEKSGFPIVAQVPMHGQKNLRRGMGVAQIGHMSASESLARGIRGMGAAFERLQPQIVLVLGDRLEMLAAASAALAQRLAIGHLHGGESAMGIWDEQIRHAITKMAQLHFCATEMARRRIVQMGEDPSRVFKVGAPALDDAVAFMRRGRRLIPKLRLVAGTSPLLLLHPSSADDNLEYARAKMLINALLNYFQDPVVCAIGPNNDPGHRGILRAFAEEGERVHVEMSLSRNTFWARLVSSGLLVGNSSSGIIEAATFGTPAINIGNRQSGRERNPNVIDVAWDESQIIGGVRKALEDKSFRRTVAKRKNIYGDGDASQRMVLELEAIAKNGLGLEKRFVD